MMQFTEVAQALPKQTRGGTQVAAIPGEQAKIVPRPCHTLRVASLTESPLRPLMPVGGRIPLAAGPGHVPEEGARDRRAAHISTLLAALKSAEQEVLGTTRLPCRPGQNPCHDEHASQAVRRGVIAHRCRVMLTWA